MLHHSWTQLAFFAASSFDVPGTAVPTGQIQRSIFRRSVCTLSGPIWWSPKTLGRAEASARLAIRVRWNPRRFIPVILLFALVDLRWWQNPQVFVAQILQIPRILVRWEHHFAISGNFRSSSIINHYNYNEPLSWTMAFNHDEPSLWTIMNPYEPSTIASGLLKMAIEIVELPFKMGGSFHSYVAVCQAG